MALFQLENRKQIAVVVAGSSLVLYEPSALHRCEFFLMSTEQIDIIQQADSQSKDAISAAANFKIGKLSRQQSAFLIAACLKPGRGEDLSELVSELEGQPDDVLNQLLEPAYQLAGVSLTGKKN